MIPNIHISCPKCSYEHEIPAVDEDSVRQAIEICQSHSCSEFDTAPTVVERVQFPPKE